MIFAPFPVRCALCFKSNIRTWHTVPTNNLTYKHHTWVCIGGCQTGHKVLSQNTKWDPHLMKEMYMNGQMSKDQIMKFIDKFHS